MTYDTELARQKKNYLERLDSIQDKKEEDVAENTHFKPINKR